MDALDVLYSIIGEDGFEPRYNISPSESPLPAGSRRSSPRRITRVPIVLQRGDELIGEDAIWPLIPVWARGRSAKVQHRQCALRGDGGQECVSQRLEARAALPDLRHRVL